MLGLVLAGVFARLRGPYVLLEGGGVFALASSSLIVRVDLMEQRLQQLLLLKIEIRCIPLGIRGWLNLLWVQGHAEKVVDVVEPTDQRQPLVGVRPDLMDGGREVEGGLHHLADGFALPVGSA